jgi:myo-inositol-1(or 4)-monophosphatase
MNWENICRDACELVVDTGKFMREERKRFDRNSVEEKSLNNLVSYVDIQSEKKLVEGLQKILPHSGFITEEKTVSQEKKELQWVIDPLDGTTNFIFDLPVYSVSVGLLENGKLVVGIVYEPVHDELFFAWKNGGAFLNNHSIHVSSTSRMEDSLLGTGFPIKHFQKLNNYLQLIGYCVQHSLGVRRMGSAAVDLAYTACGRFDAFFETNLHAWDVAGGAFIIQEAGGIVCDYSGGNDFIFGRTILGSNPVLIKKMQEIISIYFD